MANEDLIVAGTATIENGSKTVTGTGTAWSNVIEGDFFGAHVGLALPIAQVAGNVITLAFPWPGESQIDQPYAIQPKGDVARFQGRIRDLVEALANGDIGGEPGADAGGVQIFTDRASAVGSSVADDVNILIVVHSGQALLYRRYVPAAGLATYAALSTNGGTVYWAPGNEYSPLHWGATGFGQVSDLPQLTKMMQFLFGTPNSRGVMATAWDEQRPFVVTGHNRVYAIDDAWIWGNIGVAGRDTGMIYNFRVNNLRLKAIGNKALWDNPIAPGIPRQMIVAGWNFEQDYSDQVSGIYDVILDHMTFDMGFLTGATWVCNTYEFVLNEPRGQHPGPGRVMFDTSVRSANQGGTLPFGYKTGNGAYTIIRPNTEGLVGESGKSYPIVNGVPGTIDTMDTTAIRIYTNDFRIDAGIHSGTTRAFDIYGGAGQIYNIHPWSREIRIRKIANNILFNGGYIDYNKIVLESFNHKFVGVHAILPAEPGMDYGFELQASEIGETGKGLMFTGCTFGGPSLDVRYTAVNGGSWAGARRRKITFSGCTYGDGHSMTNIEQFEDRKGIIPSTGAHYFSSSDYTVGEIRMVGDTLYLGKDRTAQGGSSIQLQTQPGDQTSCGLYAYALGGMGLINSVPGGSIDFNTQAIAGALFISGTTGQIIVKRTMQISNEQGDQDGLNVLAGNVRAGGLATALKQAIALTDTVPGTRFTGAAGAIVLPSGSPTTSACLNLGRGEAGSIVRAAVAGTASAGGISVAANGTWTYATTSDERLKSSIEQIDEATVDLLFEEVSPRSFEMAGTPGQRLFGFLAQDFKRLMPESDLVTGSGVLSDDLETNDPFSMDYTKLMPFVWAKMQMLIKRVEELEK